ncbi:MAG: multicopper oxidase domain-containing protein [Deltaproteobacteria bacterium]|nr:multicopper oxidase domain-containing protein [Deltaproteobacteria bacterium]
MTRNNVYAGPAGFWLIRENGGGETGLVSGTLPGPAPVAGEDLAETNLAPGRFKYREIPIVIQDRSFDADGSLFYPANRALFEGLLDSQSGNIPSVPGNDDAGLWIDFSPYSDIAPIWNPEAFFNVMVVNGVSWPELEVAPAIYRFRLLNGCNSRFLNLSMGQVNGQGRVLREMPFYQIGAEQSVLPQVVRIETGYATPLPGDGSDVHPKRLDCRLPNGRLQNNCVPAAPAPFTEQALLMALAERADVLVDFRGRKDGDVVRMFNTAPDAPFGGFPDVPADPSTTGQVMQFRINSDLLGTSPSDPTGATPATDPRLVMLSPVDGVDTYPGDLVTETRDLALIEEESEEVCVLADAVTEEFLVPIEQVPCDTVPNSGEEVVPFGPKAAVLGVNGSNGGTVTLWSDFIETNPQIGATEIWELYNFTADGHPIHLHLVKFKVLDRQGIDEIGNLDGDPVPPEADETGWKDTVIAYPGQVTRVAATFDIEGLYVWHCHIVEHEDNEMMVPYCVGAPDANGCAGLVAPAP